MSGTVIVPGPVVSAGSAYALVDDAQIGGGYQVAATEAAIGAIPAANLKVGMQAYSQSTQITYQLTTLTPGGGFANGTWTPLVFPNGGSWSPGVATVATANITLSGEQTLNGVTTSASRVLVSAQTSSAANGIYTTASGSWTRTSDASTAGAFVLGKQVAVLGGTLAGTIYVCNAVPAVLGTNPVSFVANTTGTGFNASSPPPIGNTTPNTIAGTTITGTTYVGITAAALPTITLTGDATGAASGGTVATVVAKVNGATVPTAGSLVTGNAAFVSGASALTYSALNLAGGSGWVTGTLPIASGGTGLTSSGAAAQFLRSNGSAWVSAAIGSSDLPSLALTGDGTATIASGTGALTVVKVNGASVPAAGSLVTGNAAFVSGASALTYSALNLAGGSGWVTGTLPIASGGTGLTSSGASANFLRSNGSVWASAAIGTGDLPSLSLTGDATATIASGTGAVTVVQIQGKTFSSSAPTKGQFVVATSTAGYGPVTISGDVSESSATAGLVTTTGLYNNPMQNWGTLGSAQSGTVVTWNNAAGQFQMLAPSVAALLFSACALYDKSSDSVAVTCTAQNTYYVIPWKNLGQKINVTATNAANTFTILGAGTYDVACTMSVDTGGGTHNYQFSVFVNGTQDTSMVAEIDSLLNTGTVSVALTGIRLLALSDVVDVRVQCTDAASTSLNVVWGNFSITSIGGTSNASAPTLDALSYPYLAPAAGGGPAVTLTGSNLTTVTNVTINGNPASSISSTSTTVTFNWPGNAAQAAAYNVVVTAPSGSVTLNSAVYYLPSSVAVCYYAAYGFNAGTGVWTDRIASLATTADTAGTSATWTNGQPALSGHRSHTTTPSVSLPYAFFFVGDTATASDGAASLHGINIGIEATGSGTSVNWTTAGAKAVSLATPFLFEAYINGASSYSSLNNGSHTTFTNSNTGSGVDIGFRGNTTVNWSTGHCALFMVANSPTSGDETIIHGIVSNIYATP